MKYWLIGALLAVLVIALVLVVIQLQWSAAGVVGVFLLAALGLGLVRRETEGQ